MNTQSVQEHWTNVKNRDGVEFRVGARLAIHWDPKSWTKSGRRTDESKWSDAGKVRVFWSDEYVSVNEEDVLGIKPPYGFRGDNLEDDRAWDAYNRWHKKMTKQVMAETMSRALGREVEPKAVSYSSKAGCTMCACSPGFVTSRDLGFALRKATGGALSVGRCDLSIRWHSKKN